MTPARAEPPRKVGHSSPQCPAALKAAANDSAAMNPKIFFIFLFFPFFYIFSSRASPDAVKPKRVYNTKII
jgi:hypothetical protein